MYSRTTFAGLPGLLAAMLLAVGCTESTGPNPRASRLSPVALLVDRGLNLDFAGGQPTSGQLPTGYGCMDLPLGLNNIVAAVTVKDNLGNTISDFDGDVTVALQQNASSALLCGQTTVHVAPSDMGVAHFTNLGVQQPTIQPTYYTLMATAVATSGESVAPKESATFCVGVCSTP